MIKILVTGANGLLGQKLTLLLDGDPQFKLVATARGKLNVPLTRGTFRVLDVTNTREVENVIRAEKPDVVIHTAAMTQVDQCELERDKCWLNNVTAVENVVKSCERHNTHLVHLSTDFVFDGSFGPLDETARPHPISYYGESKLAGEEIVIGSKLSWTIVRTVLVYGITQGPMRSNIVLWVKKSLEDGKTIQVVNDQWRTPTLAEDLAKGCRLAAVKRAKGIFHISGEEMMTPYDIALRTADFFKLDKSLIKETDSNNFKQPAARPPKTGFVITKAKQELGFKPHSFDEGLRVLKSQIH